MDQKLYSNFMNPNFQPTIMNTPIKEEIAILKADQFGIITLACSGTVFCYELYSLELKWWVSFLEFWKHSSKKVPQEVVPSFLPMYRSIQRFPSQGSNLCMNNDRIFIANRIGHLMILNRSNGEKIYETPPAPGFSVPKLCRERYFLIQIYSHLEPNSACFSNWKRNDFSVFFFAGPPPLQEQQIKQNN